MAIGTESYGQIQEFLDVLRRRRWQIVLPALYVLALGVAYAVIAPRKYEITTEVEIKESRLEPDYQLRDPNENATKKELQNAAKHIRHNKRIQSILAEKPEHWPEYFALSRGDRQEFINRIKLALRIEIGEKRKDYGSTFITIVYTDVNAARGEAFLERLNALWMEEVVDQDRTRLEKERDILQNLEETARKDFNRLSQSHTDLAKQMNINPMEAVGSVGRDPWDRNGDDPQYSDYYDLSSRQKAADSDLARGEGMLGRMREELAREPERVPRLVEMQGVDNTREIEGLRLQILALEEQRSKWTPLNSMYRTVGDRIHDLEERIREFHATQTAGAMREIFEPNPNRPGMIARIAEQEALVEGMRSELERINSQLQVQEATLDRRAEDYRQLIFLGDERASAKLILSSAAQNLKSKKDALEVLNKAIGDPYDVVIEPTSTEQPVEPKPLLILTVAIIAGLAIGLALAVVSEYAPNSYRNVYEVSRVMGVPILGAIDSITTKAQRRKARALRALVGVCCLAILAGLSWFIYLAGYSPEALPTEVREGLEDIRDMLM